MAGLRLSVVLLILGLCVAAQAVDWEYYDWEDCDCDRGQQRRLKVCTYGCDPGYPTQDYEWRDCYDWTEECEDDDLSNGEIAGIVVGCVVFVFLVVICIVICCWSGCCWGGGCDSDCESMCCPRPIRRWNSGSSISIRGPRIIAAPQVVAAPQVIAAPQPQLIVQQQTPISFAPAAPQVPQIIYR